MEKKLFRTCLLAISCFSLLNLLFLFSDFEMDVSISSFFMSSPLGLMSGDECSGVRDGDFPTFGNDFHCLGKELFFSVFLS